MTTTTTITAISEIEYSHTSSNSKFYLVKRDFSNKEKTVPTFHEFRDDISQIRVKKVLCLHSHLGQPMYQKLDVIQEYLSQHRCTVQRHCSLNV